jgi:prophage regulatory protein
MESTEKNTAGQSARMIPLPEVIRLTSRSRSRIYAEVQTGAFPAPVKDGFSSRWLESEILTWIAERVDHRNSRGGTK